MSDFSKIIGSLQIHDNTIDISKLEVNFLSNKDWKINGDTINNKATITTIPNPNNEEDVANKRYVDQLKIQDIYYLRKIYAKKNPTGYISFNDLITLENTDIGIYTSNVIISTEKFINTSELKIILNDNILFTSKVDYRNENGSLIRFNPVDLTAEIIISTADMTPGKNILVIRQEVSTTNKISWIFEPDNISVNKDINRSIVIAEEHKYLSGVEYISKAYFNIYLKFYNLLKFTYSSEELPIKYKCINCISNDDAFNTINSSESVIAIDKRIDISAEYINNEPAEIQVSIVRPSRSNISEVINTENILFDSAVSKSTSLFEDFKSETFRRQYNKLNNSFYDWDSTLPLNDDLQVGLGKLFYCRTKSELCTYYRLFNFDSFHQNFLINIEGTSFNIVQYSDGLFDNNNITIQIFTSKWIDVVSPFNGDPDSVSSFVANINNDFPNKFVFTLGINFCNSLILKISAPPSWDGYINKIKISGM